MFSRNTKEGELQMSSFITGVNEYYTLRLDLLGGATPYKVEELKYQHSLIENGNLTFGNTPSASISFDLYEAGPSIDNSEITLWRGTEKEDADIKYACIGTFKVRQTSYDGIKHSYEGYDAMVYALSGTYKSTLDWSGGKMWHTSDVMKDIMKQSGIAYLENANCPLSAVLISEPKNLSYRTVIGYIAGLDGYNAVIDYTDTGVPYINMICFRKWSNPDDVIIDDERIYEDSGFELANKDIKKIGYVKTSTSEQNYLISGNVDAAYGITTYNPYMNQDWNDDVMEMYSNINMNVLALTVKFLGCWDIRLGDIVPVTLAGLTYNVPVMSIIQECDGGLVTTITSYLEDTTTENAASQTVESNASTDTSNKTESELADIKERLKELDEITPENIDKWYGEVDGTVEEITKAKKDIADALTVMGVETSATDSFSTMAENILKIQGGGGDNPEGRKIIAKAITDMGVATDYNDSYRQMADNIMMIKTSIQDIDNVASLNTPAEKMINVAGEIFVYKCSQTLSEEEE